MMALVDDILHFGGKLLSSGTLVDLVELNEDLVDLRDHVAGRHRSSKLAVSLDRKNESILSLTNGL